MAAHFSDLKVSDSQITEILLVGDEVRLTLRDRQGRRKVIKFEGVVGVEAIGATGVDLSHAGESSDDPCIRKACEHAGVPLKGHRSFTLTWAWTNEPVLRIIARGFHIHPDLHDSRPSANKDSKTDTADATQIVSP
jgi:hypothetical protein